MINVIVIEDLVNYRHALQALLDGSADYTCVAAFESAEKALSTLSGKEIDVALVDIHLPGMNGITLVKKLREMFPDLLCMMCTAYDEDEEVFQALKAGAHGYLLKSTPPLKILESIRDLVEGGSPMSNEIARKIVSSFQQAVPLQDSFELTKRETEVLENLSQGLLYKEIAAKLFVSIDTVRRHCFNVYSKLHVKNKTEAINKYFGKPNG